jgi:hypothetical protein
MTQYFYTNPLAAAWMARRFGMKLTSAPTEEPDEPGELSTAYMEEFESRGPYYIHLDSLPILEPQIGDFVFLSSELGDVFKVCGDPPDSDIAFGQDRMHMIPISIVRKRLTSDLAIIRRNGIAFMWPESILE